MSARLLRTTAGPVLSIALALAVTTVFLSASGYSAASAYSVMWDYGTTGPSLVSALNGAVPLYLAGTAAAFGLRMGLFNIGIDGQYRVAALAGAVAAAQLPGPLAVRLPLTLLVSCAVGAAWALLPALLKIRRGVNEVITSIILNAVATTVVAILLTHAFRSGGGQGTGTATIGAAGSMPALLDTGLGSRGEVSGFLALAVLVGVAFHLVADRTSFGYSVRVAALSPAAAASAGIRVPRTTVLVMLGSGAIAGLVGLPHVLGVAHRYDGTLPTDLMFTGLSAALLGRAHPVGIALGAFVLAFVERSSQVLGLVGLPSEVGQLFVAVVLLGSAVAYWLVERADRRLRLARAGSRGAADDEHEVGDEAAAVDGAIPGRSTDQVVGR